MGNQQFEKTKQFLCHEEEWVQTATPTIYQHKKTKKLGEMRGFDNSSEIQIEIYDFRHQYRRYLVDVLGLIVNESTTICTKQTTFRVITEFIPYRLPDLGPISYKDSIYILYQCLSGLKILRQKYNWFEVEEEMIGFTQKGVCKIWVNSNYHSNKNQNANFDVPRQSIEALFQQIEQKMTFNEQQKVQYKLIRSRYTFKDFKSAFSFLNQLKVINGITDNYKVILPCFEEASHKRDEKFSLKGTSRRRNLTKINCQKNPQVVKENKEKGFSGSSTQRSFKTPGITKIKDTSTPKYSILKKKIKIEKNIQSSVY